MVACARCGVQFEAKSTRRRFCSARCRAATWQGARKDREARLRELVKLMARETGLKPEDLT
jgi:hypothetical protein